MPNSGPAFGHVVTGPDQVILEVDDAFVEIVGRDRGALLGSKALSFTYREDLTRNQPMLDRLTVNGPAFSITKRYIRSDRSIVWVRNQVSILKTGLGEQRICATCIPMERPADVGRLARNHRIVKRLCDLLVMGRQRFTADVVSAPAAETLLLLYRAEIECEVVTLAAIADRIGLSASVMQRWVRMLQQRGLVEDETGSGLGTDAVLRISQTAEHAIARLLVPFGGGEPGP